MAVKAEHSVQWFRLVKFHRETLHGREERMAKIWAELRRIREYIDLPQRVTEEADS
jgi:predicted transposase YbfD/YdcC